MHHNQGHSMSPRRPLITLHFTSQLFPMFLFTLFIFFRLYCRFFARISVIQWPLAFKHISFTLSLIIPFFELRLVKGESGRDGREGRGRYDRWSDCVKGLITSFSGPVSAGFSDEPGPILRDVKFMTAAYFYSPLCRPPPPCLRSCPEGREEARSD